MWIYPRLSMPRQLELVLDVDRMTDDPAEHPTGNRADHCALHAVTAHDSAEDTTGRGANHGVALGVANRLAPSGSRRIDAAARGRPTARRRRNAPHRGARPRLRVVDG